MKTAINRARSTVLPNPQLRKKHGIWVYRTGESLSAAKVFETVRKIRRERDARNLGQEL